MAALEKPTKRIIINNHSNKPLYQIIEAAYDVYFKEGICTAVFDKAGFWVDVKQNKSSVSINIYNYDGATEGRNNLPYTILCA